MLEKMKTKNEKGIFLIGSYLVLTVIGTFSLALFLKSAAVYRATERAQNRITAFHLAESGVDRALVQLRTNSSYAGQGYTILGSGGGYIVGVSQPQGSPSNIRLIQVAGQTPNDSSLVNIALASPCPDTVTLLNNLTRLPRAYECRQITAYVSVSNSPFNNAIFAKQKIEMKGNTVTDSYDSRTGVLGSNGDIGTNGTAAGIISLSGNVQVKGDAVVGPGANVSTAIKIGDNAILQGTESAAPTVTTLDPVVIPPDLTNSGALSISGTKIVTKPGGTYLFSSIKISGSGKLSFTGPATVYVTGKIEIGGNGIGTAQNLPPNLLMYAQGGEGDIKVSGNGNLYGAIYAPDREVEVSGNGKIFGAVVGDTIENEGNALIRYDEALQTVKGNSSTNTVKMKSWQEP